MSYLNEENETTSFRLDHERQHNNNCDAIIVSKIETSPKDVNKVEKLLNPWSSPLPFLWNKIFIISCVIGVLIDPLFLYVFVINEEKKCLAYDKRIMYVAVVLRTVTDLFYVFHIVIRLRNALKMARNFKISLFGCRVPWSYLFIDVLAIIPLPQVVVLKFFSKLAGSRSLMTRKILNVLLFLQYIPRLLRVFISAKELGRSFDSLTQRVWIRGAFFFFLYIIFGHIFGALWYFYAIFRETACWHLACKRLDGCVPNPFDCGMPNPIKNMTYLNEVCPVDPTNPKVYDFGMFSDAIEHHILTKYNFLRKFTRCFWWGLRNLSSFGQNLNTSSDEQENLFAILISVLGLLLFLYLIGTLQTYMQCATTKSEEARMKIKSKKPEIDSYLSNHSLPEPNKKVIEQYLIQAIREDKDVNVRHLFALLEEHKDSNSETRSWSWVTKIMDMKKHERYSSDRNAELWLSHTGFSVDIKHRIMRYVQLRFQEGKDVDLTNIIPILPPQLALLLKKLLCVQTLKKVPMLKNMHESVYETICNYLKPVVYSEKSYIIRKEEPLDFILLLTNGIALSFGGRNNPTVRLRKGDFFGEELLEWQLNSSSYDRFPMSEVNLKCQTKVEAFGLMAPDLEHVLSICWTRFLDKERPILKGLNHFAAKSLQQWFQRRFKQNNKKEKDSDDKINVITEE